MDMWARAHKVLERVLRPARNYLAPGGIVLGYHRVADVTWDPLKLNISRKNFCSQLDLISNKYNPVSLESLVALKRRGASLSNCVSITFDDGCEEFIHCALPELLARNIPATVFVTTGYAGEPFWWDEVSQLIGRGSPNVETIELDFCSTGGKRVFDKLNSEERAEQAVRQICDQLLNFKPAARSRVIEQIRGQIARDPTPGCIPCAMTQEQLYELSEIALVEIGAHSVTHPLLSRLNETEQTNEIQTSKSELEALGIKVIGFAYPNGSFSQQTCDLVKSSGFSYACTSRQAAVRQGDDCYQLPRIWAPNIGGKNFDAWISAWSGRRH